MQIQFKFNKCDEYETPIEAIIPIEKYLKKHSIIWCPFDKSNSNYVKCLESKGHKVKHSHISEGKDFFKCNVKSNIDYIVSNPPYSKKTEVFKRLLDLNIPFAMLINIQGIFDNKERFAMFKNIDLQFMYLYPRVRYIKDGIQQKGNIFQSVYMCKGILPKQIVLENIINI